MNSPTLIRKGLSSIASRNCTPRRQAFGLAAGIWSMERVFVTSHFSDIEYSANCGQESN